MTEERLENYLKTFIDRRDIGYISFSYEDRVKTKVFIGIVNGNIVWFGSPPPNTSGVIKILRRYRSEFNHPAFSAGLAGLEAEFKNQKVSKFIERAIETWLLDERRFTTALGQSLVVKLERVIWHKGQCDFRIDPDLSVLMPISGIPIAKAIDVSQNRVKQWQELEHRGITPHSVLAFENVKYFYSGQVPLYADAAIKSAIDRKLSIDGIAREICVDTLELSQMLAKAIDKGNIINPNSSRPLTGGRSGGKLARPSVLLTIEKNRVSREISISIANKLGYQLLATDDIDTAIAMFERNNVTALAIDNEFYSYVLPLIDLAECKQTPIAFVGNPPGDRIPSYVRDKPGRVQIYRLTNWEYDANLKARYENDLIKFLSGRN